ncbi:MAG TPA: tripartite tricarboxylate transporter substrate binding protein [Bauldia sp.]|nr:tripartite tricarboxylate transporter substrate binding protein [Bauldia sp.]
MFLAAAFVAASTLAASAFPDKEIQLLIPFPAGGGTDAIGRVLANGLEKELGKPVIVINRVGGAGVLAHNEVANAEPDGHTIALIAVDLVTFKWLGMADLTYRDVTPVALINTDAATFTVSADSKWADMKAALAAIKEAPSQTYSIASLAGSGNYTAVASLLLADGTEPGKLLAIPQSAAPGLLELAAGGVDIAPFSLSETRAMMDAGKVKPLVVFSSARVPGFDDVPTAAEATGYDIVGGTWRGIAAPKGTPDAVRDQLEAAVKKVWESDEFQSFMKERSFGLTWMGHEEFTAFMDSQEKQFGTVLESIGLKK